MGKRFQIRDKNTAADAVVTFNILGLIVRAKLSNEQI